MGAPAGLIAECSWSFARTAALRPCKHESLLPIKLVFGEHPAIAQISQLAKLIS